VNRQSTSRPPAPPPIRTRAICATIIRVVKSAAPNATPAPATELIADLQKLRDSKVIAYVIGDRNPIPAQIGDDAVRPLYDHLRELGHVKRLDLFLYSRGGAIDVPWRIVTALRRTADEVSVLVPFRANSAATLIALGADEIVLGRHGELGPIDPSLNIPHIVPQPGGPPTMVPDEVRVEDVMSYVRFIRERAGLSDQASLASGLALLGNRLDAVVLGNLYRTHSHIRDVARRMLSSRRKPPSVEVAAVIIETLAGRVYAHGHAIGYQDAEAIGLPVHAAEGDLDDLMWTLVRRYEMDLKLLEPIDPFVKRGAADTYSEDVISAVVESEAGRHEHGGKVEITAQRQIPASLNVSVNLNLQVPPGSVDPQQLLQTLQAPIAQQAQQAVLEALRAQAPIANAQLALRDGQWRRVR
jgi:Serine dehydrogenase proteinase